MYTNLKSYQQALLIHDFTVEFIHAYIDISHKTDASYKTYSRQADQMIQAARSGKQNIAEGSANSKQKPKSETMLLGVASASLKELLEDYKDYLRQHQLPVWGMNDPRALVVRNLYKTHPTYTTDQTYQSYKSYLSDPERACNAMLCLISQTTYLLDQQIKGVEKQMEEKGMQLEPHAQKVRRIVAEERKRLAPFEEEAQKAADEAATRTFGHLCLIGLIGLGTIGLISLICLIGVPTTAHASTLILPPNNINLVGYWSMNEGSGTTGTLTSIV